MNNCRESQVTCSSLWSRSCYSVLSCIILYFSITVILRFNLSLSNQVVLALWHIMPLGPWFNILLWTELAIELLGAFRRDGGGIIKNTIVYLDDRVNLPGTLIGSELAHLKECNHISKTSLNFSLKAFIASPTYAPAISSSFERL